MKKTIAALAAIAVAMLGVLIAPATAAFADGTINGTITDAATSLPINGATVQFAVANGSNNFFTDATGQFTSTFASGTYTVSISAPGYATEYYDDTYDLALASLVSVTDSQTTTINASLKPESTIAGTVTDYLNAPVVGAFAVLYSANAGWVPINSNATDVSGAYSFGQLAPGDYKVDVFYQNDNLQDTWYTTGYSQATATAFTVPSFGSHLTGIDVQLALGAEITGTVVDPLGSPVSVQVSAEGAGLDYALSGQSNNLGGVYSIPGLRPQAYNVTTDDQTDFFAPAVPAAVTAVVGSPATANLVVSPRLPDESEFFDAAVPVSGPTSVEAGKTYTWVVDTNGDANVFAILYSNPVYLGGAVRNPDNTATLTLTIPADTVAGAHKLTFSSYRTDKQGTSISREYLDITVTAASLAKTGVDPLFGTAGALLTLLAGLAVVLYARRAPRT